MPHEDDAEEPSFAEDWREPEERCLLCGGAVDSWGFCRADCVTEEDGEE